VLIHEYGYNIERSTQTDLNVSMDIIIKSDMILKHRLYTLFYLVLIKLSLGERDVYNVKICQSSSWILKLKQLNKITC